MVDLFFVNKTGLEMFDVSRAYGLAFALQGIATERDLEVKIEDKNYTYIITADGELQDFLDPQVLEVAEDGLSQIFRNPKIKSSKGEVKEILTEEYGKILDLHRNPGYHPEIGKKVKDGRTIYQSLDVSASKGFREPKLGSRYIEGDQITVDKYSWAIGCLGAAIVAKRRSVGTEMRSHDWITLIPNPLKVFVDNHRQIQEDLKAEKGICTISSTTAIVHYAIKIAKKVLESKESFDIKYDSIVFNLVKSTGHQTKPGGGGKYSLSFIDKVANEKYGYKALERLDEILRLGRLGFKKGLNQSLALALADFLIHPTLDNFRRCEDLNIRGYINENVPLWKEGELEAILRHVEVV